MVCLFCDVNRGCVNSVYNGLPFYGYSLGGKVSVFSKMEASAVKSVGVLESSKVNKIIGVIIG